MLDHKYMDANQLNTLDPKLREAYERVMGTTAVPRPPQQPPVAPPPPPQPTTVTQNSSPIEQAKPEPVIPQTTAPLPPIATVQTPQTIASGAPIPSVPLASLDSTSTSQQMHAYVADEVEGVKQSLKLIQVVYIVGGLVFFAVYALFWMIFFNVASPF